MNQNKPTEKFNNISSTCARGAVRDVVHRTMSMTSFRRLWRCRLLRFWKMSQFSWCRSLKPTARWWFSKTDSSLYMRASSESGHSEQERRGKVSTRIAQTEKRVFNSRQREHVCVCLLTGVDEELIGNSGVVYIVDSCSE